MTVPGDGTLAGAYFLAARGYRPETLAAGLPCAILVMQGGRDYQVTMRDDFEAWRKALERHPRATFKTYPPLDHRGVAGVGPSTPEQYVEPGHVAEQVVDDIAAWIQSLS